MIKVIDEPPYVGLNFHFADGSVDYLAVYHRKWYILGEGAVKTGDCLVRLVGSYGFDYEETGLFNDVIKNGVVVRHGCDACDLSSNSGFQGSLAWVVEEEKLQIFLKTLKEEIEKNVDPGISDSCQFCKIYVSRAS